MHFKTADVAGLRLFYREAGDPAKPTIVLLHGFPSSSYQFHDLIPLLADRFRVITPDYPGMGYSEAPDGTVLRPTIDDMAMAIDAFIAECAPGVILKTVPQLVAHRPPPLPVPPVDVTPQKSPLAAWTNPAYGSEPLVPSKLNMVSVPFGVIWKIVPQPKAQAVFPPFCVVPKRLPSRPWTSVAQGAAPSALSKLSSILKVCAGKVTAAVANATKSAHALVYHLDLLMDSPHSGRAFQR
jgi:hypothetical protein